jgi:hypothetical protein
MPYSIAATVAFTAGENALTAGYLNAGKSLLNSYGSAKYGWGLGKSPLDF